MLSTESVRWRMTLSLIRAKFVGDERLRVPTTAIGLRNWSTWSRHRARSGRRDGLGSVTDRQEEPSAVARGFFFWCIRVVKLGAEALDVNAMMPGRFCPAFLIDLQHVACAANPSVVVGRPLGLDSLVVAAGVCPPLFPPPNRTVGCEAAPRPVEDRPQSGLHTAFAIASETSLDFPNP